VNIPTYVADPEFVVVAEISFVEVESDAKLKSLVPGEKVMVNVAPNVVAVAVVH
jgi:hypothetical protein